jgi:hypothetical protein
VSPPVISWEQARRVATTLVGREPALASYESDALAADLAEKKKRKKTKKTPNTY